MYGVVGGPRLGVHLAAPPLDFLCGLNGLVGGLTGGLAHLGASTSVCPWAPPKPPPLLCPVAALGGGPRVP